MKLIQAKSEKDITLKGITVSFEHRDTNLSSCTLTDADGHTVKFAIESYTALRAYVPAPPEKKTVHAVTGTVRGLGTPIREEFEQSYQATARMREIDDLGIAESLDVRVEEIEVPA